MRALVLALVPLAVAAQTVLPFSEATQERQDYCVARASERVCWRTVGDDGRGRFDGHRGGQSVTWDAEPPGAYAALRAFRLDLDGGRSGLVVAAREAISNGLGVEYWTMFVVPDGASEPAYQFTAEDLGPDSAPFATWNGKTVFWATEWQTADDPSGRRGPGTYLVGRPFRLGPTGLIPATTLPVRTRRMLSDFRRESGGPVAWLASRRAETRRVDPFGAGRAGGERAEIVEVGEVADGYPLTVRVGGRRRTFQVDPWAGGDTAARLADGATGRVFPPEYRPAGLVGRSVRLGTGPDGSSVIWLD